MSRKRKKIWLQCSCIAVSFVLEAQKNRCFYCGQFMAKDNKKQLGRSKEHLIPRSEGKKSPFVAFPIVWAHRECNQKRATRPLTQKERLRAHYVKIAAVAAYLSSLT